MDGMCPPPWYVHIKTYSCFDVRSSLNGALIFLIGQLDVLGTQAILLTSVSARQLRSPQLSSLSHSPKDRMHQISNTFTRLLPAIEFADSAFTLSAPIEY